MYRPSSGPSSLSSSSRSKESSTSGSRSGASASGSTRGRSPRRSRSPSPRSRRRHRSPSSSRSPSPRRSSRARSPSSGSRSRRGSEQRDGSLSRGLSLGRHSQFPGKCSPPGHLESSEERSLQPEAGDDHYGIDPLEGRIRSDRVGLPVDSLSDVNRSDFVDSPVFSRHLSCPQSHELSPPSSFNRRYHKDYHSSDVYQLDFNKNYDCPQDISREPHGDSEMFRKYLYSSEERGPKPKHPQYDREDRMIDVNVDNPGLLPSKWNYHKIIPSRSPSPRYQDKDFRETENSRTKKNTCQDSPSSGYVIPDLNMSVQSSEPQFLHTPEKAPAMPIKSILKKRVDDPSVQNFGNFLSKKEHQESTSASTDLHEDFPLPYERASLDEGGISYSLDGMADSASTQEERRHSLLDVEDAETFLYDDDEGDSNVNCPSTEELTMNGGKESASLNKRPPSPILPVKPDTSEGSRTEYEKIRDLLKTIGFDVGLAEIGKGAARTQERLHGKTTLRSPDGLSHKVDVTEEDSIQSHTRPSESNQKNSSSPCGSSQPSNDISSALVLEHAKIKTLEYTNSAGPPEQSFPSVSVTPSVPPSLPNLPPPPPPISLSHFSAFLAAQGLQNYPPPIIALPTYNAYGHCSAYSAKAWPMYPPPPLPNPPLPNVHGLASVTVPPHPTRSNLRVIKTVSTVKENSEIKGHKSVLADIPIALPQSPGGGTTERISDGKKPASEKPQVIEEGEKLMSEQEAKQKKLDYLMTELNRHREQQLRMLQNKEKAKGKKKDPLLIEVKRVQENIAKEIVQLQIECPAIEFKKSHLDIISHITGINTLQMSGKKASENVDCTEEKKADNKKTQEKTSTSINEYLNESPLSKDRRNLGHWARFIPIQEAECSLKQKLRENQNEDSDERSVKVARREESEITKDLGGKGPPLSLAITSTLDKPAAVESSDIKSSNAKASGRRSTELLPVVKNSNPNSPNIAKAFRGGAVTLKSSQEKVKLQEKVEMKLQESESVSDFVERARVQKQKVTEAEAQKHGAEEEWPMLKRAKMKQELKTSQKPPSVIPGPPPLLSLPLRPMLPLVPALPHPPQPPFPLAVSEGANKGHSLCTQTSQKPHSPSLIPRPPSLLSLPLRPPLSLVSELPHPPQPPFPPAVSESANKGHSLCTQTSQKPHSPSLKAGPPSLLSLPLRPPLSLVSELPHPPQPLFPPAVSEPANTGHSLCTFSVPHLTRRNKRKTDKSIWLQK